MSDYRQCPFDPLHLIVAKKFALHLVKCKRQHPDVKLVKCHFDTSHLVKEAELRDHMKTCSGRNELLRYKVTINRAVCDDESKLPDPAEDLVYSTPEPSRQKVTDGITLQDDSECWDDFAYKAYDPLENCKSKLKNGIPFIMPIANRFAGQMQDAAALKEDQVKDVPEESKELIVQAKCSQKIQREERGYDRKDSGGSSSYRSDVKQEPSDYDSESAGYSSSSKQHKYREKDFGASSSSSGHKVEGDTRQRIQTEERSHRSRDRSRSDSTCSSDRKSHRYDGHSYPRSYDASHSRHRRDRYEADRNGSYRRDYDRHTDSDTSDRSYRDSKHKLKPYQRYY